MKIESLQDISRLLVDGYEDWYQHGHVTVKHNGDLTLFNYQRAAIFNNQWTFFERVSRGLIIDNKIGGVEARPFDKFFNWGEGDRTTTADISFVTEKYDGSLGILYYDDPVDSDYSTPRIATRGSFDGEQAVWATEFFQERWKHFPQTDWTLMFEIIYPENRVVVDYGDTEDMILLAARSIGSGRYMPYLELREMANTFGFNLVPFYAHNVRTLIEEQKRIDVNQEGWVAYFEDGSIFKFKGEQYMELHKSIMGLTWKNTVKAVRDGQEDAIRAIIPEEFLGEFNRWVDYITRKAAKRLDQIYKALYHAPKGDSREAKKEFALWAQAEHPEIEQYLYAARDGHDFESMILDWEFKEEPDV